MLSAQEGTRLSLAVALTQPMEEEKARIVLALPSGASAPGTDSACAITVL